MPAGNGCKNNSDSETIRDTVIHNSSALIFIADSPPGLPAYVPHRTPKKKKKKCYSDIIGLKEYPVQYALSEWQVFCLFLGDVQPKTQMHKGGITKFICGSWPPTVEFSIIYI